jgi:phospholipase/lecithinase/hemolysin
MLRKFPASVAALLLTAITPAQAASFSALYSFGDSLSDVGNYFINSGGISPAPPYANGQFSNGPLWVKDLSAAWGLGTVTASLAGGNDYAWAGATTANPTTASSIVPNGDQQVATFLNAHKSVAPSDGLYTFWIGINDLQNILGSGVSSSTALTEAKDAAAAEASEITTLANAGAKTFIVPLIPDLSITPPFHAQSLAQSVTSSYNTALETDLAGLAGSLSGGLHFLDTFSLLDAVVADPAAFGFTDVTNPCYARGPGGGVCATPDTYLFWAGVHMTAAANALIAKDAALLAPSPTPGAGLLSLGALILIALTKKKPEFLTRSSEN